VPDLPVLTTSERTAFRRCPQRWYWQYRMGLIPKGETPDALWFGIGVHEALAQWYDAGSKRGISPAVYWRNWSEGEERDIRANLPDRDREWDDKPKFEEAHELGSEMLLGYTELYGKDPQWEVLAVERQFRVLVKWHGEPIAEFWSTWDGVYYDNVDGRIKLMEHKTATQIQTAYLELDDQAGLYWAVAAPLLRDEGVLGQKDNIHEITYNFLRKSMPDDRPRDESGAYLNKDGTVSKKQPPPYFVRHAVERTAAERRSQMERLAGEVAHMNAVRRGDLPVTKSTTKDCTLCPFFTMCKIHERGGKAWEHIMRADYDQIYPYERYNKSAAA
jgi:hypothetical protein